MWDNFLSSEFESLTDLSGNQLTTVDKNENKTTKSLFYFAPFDRKMPHFSYVEDARSRTHVA